MNRIFLTLGLIALASVEVNAQDCNIYGLTDFFGDSIHVINIATETGLPEKHRTISEGIGLDSEYDFGTFNPKTKNYILFSSPGETDDSMGVYIVNYDTGGVVAHFDTNVFLQCLSYDNIDNKIYGIGYYSADFDSAFTVSVNETTGEITRIAEFDPNYEITEPLYAYNPKTKNFLINELITVNEKDTMCFLTVNVNTGLVNIKETVEDIVSVIYDVDSNAFYALEDTSSSDPIIELYPLNLYKVNEQTGIMEHIKELDTSLTFSPYPNFPPAYNQENKTVYIVTINNAETDNTLLMVDLQTGKFTENDSLWDKYGKEFNFLHYSCMIKNTYNTISPAACGSYESPSGKYKWTLSGKYNDTIPNSTGGDSIITVNLTVNKVNTEIQNANGVLTAEATNAIYQWMKCDNYTSISGAKEQSFTPSESGNYAAIITQNGCTDTSACQSIQTVSVKNVPTLSKLRVFPNPTMGEVKVTLEEDYQELEVQVKNVLGQKLFSKTFEYGDEIIFRVDVTGLYLISIKTNLGYDTVIKLIKK